MEISVGAVPGFSPCGEMRYDAVIVIAEIRFRPNRVDVVISCPIRSQIHRLPVTVPGIANDFSLL